ncbi:MAG: hypothetical protein ASARMPREDX12_003630 [Alectoria sarmentosa]|nr:MAG: hypothetical protein ASARMPREDX12_003630 [Alectoria sarmentosa]
MKVYKPLPIRLLTHNIRYATNAPFKGEEKWVIRKPRLINELSFNTAHAESFICLQEVLHQQLLDILSGLNSRLNNEKKVWDYVGVGRDDGKQAGEYSPILYRPDIWEPKTQKTKWLSKTPDRPSKSWDAASTRILTIAVFQHRSTGKTVVGMNTHLDDQGSKSRLEAAKIILEQIRLFTNQVPYQKSPPIFLTGDFNSEPEQEAYNEMTSPTSPMADLQMMVPENERYGDSNTFTGFDSKNRKRIDFIFVNKEDTSLASSNSKIDTPERWWLVEGYAVLSNRFEDRVYNSDHQVVVGDLTIL